MKRLKETITLFFIIFNFISCSSAPVKYSDSEIIPNDFFGLVHAGKLIDHYPLLDELGSVWFLQTFYWNDIEPVQGEFDFKLYDNFVNLAKENGKKVIAVMGYSTSWTSDKGRYISKENIPYFLNYLETTVNRYKGFVDAWQIWNEPNHIFWKGTDSEFFELSRLSAQRIRETDPDAYIIGGGMLRTPVQFIKGMHKSGAFENLDAISFHPYAINPYWSMKHYDNFIDTILKLNFKGEIWITEIGYPTGGLYPTRVSIEKLSSYVIKTIIGSVSRGARTLFWYQFTDPHNEGEYPNKNNSEHYFGLTYPDGTKKSGAFAYELCARYLPGSRYTPLLPVKENIPHNIVSFCFMDGALGNTLIIWNDIDIKQKIKISLASSFNRHNISTGENNSFSQEIILDITDKPVFITWQGAAAPRISKVRVN
ncbi:MAG: endo-1,4-beta-xylanase [Treponema sp.]|nr:endo-1,4-beta-xylanase [Treponema sp.]